MKKNTGGNVLSYFDILEKLNPTYVWFLLHLFYSDVD